MDSKKIYSASKRSSKIGLEPGSMVYVGQKKDQHAQVQIISYAKDFFQHQVLVDDLSIEFLNQVSSKTDTFHWIHVTGVHHISFMNQLKQIFNLDSLLMEDILNTDQRPKVEELEHCIFVLIKYVKNHQLKNFSFDQVSFILTKNNLFTFSDDFPESFHHVVKKIEQASSQIRNNSLDFLMYFLMDAIVDEYFVLIEHLHEVIDKADQNAIQASRESTLLQIQGLKREVKNIRKIVYPVQEVIYFLEKSKSPFFQRSTFRYLRDLAEHIHYISESIEGMKDSVNGMMELYLSNLNAKTNEIVKVLTLMSSIFIPLTFIVGVYGMNFKYMPELEWRYGYFFTWGIMLFSAIGMVTLFRYKKWL